MHYLNVLSWEAATLVAATLAAATVVARLRFPDRVPTARAAAREGALVLGLFGLWQLVGGLARHDLGDALARGRWVVSAERWLHLPSELDVQHLIIPHELLTKMCNAFYVYGHWNGIVVFLVWLWLRHPEAYPRARNALVLLTAASLAIHLLPTAPPRLLTGYGFVDTAARYGQSVYNGGIADQLSALPSVHVGWAVLVAWFAVRVGSGRWRWLTVLHPLATGFVVVATANHWWLDGLLAIALFAAVLAVQRLPAFALSRYARPRSRTETPAPASPARPAAG